MSGSQSLSSRARTGSRALQPGYLNDLNPHGVVVGVASLVESEAHSFIPVDGYAVQIMIRQGQPHLKGRTTDMSLLLESSHGIREGLTGNCFGSRAYKSSLLYSSEPCGVFHSFLQ